MHNGSAYLITVCALLSGAHASANTAVVESTGDNTLYETATGNTSNGVGPSIVVGCNNQATNNKRRALMKFDVQSSVPAGSTITSVTLTLSMLNTSSGAQNVELHRALVNWGEGISNAGGSPGNGTTAASGDATWLHAFYNSVLWTTPGGDFSTTVSAVQSVAGIGTYSWSGAQLIADVQSMLEAPAFNYGWTLIGNEAALQTTKTFSTRENTAPAQRPSLLIEFTPPASVAAWKSYD